VVVAVIVSVRVVGDMVVAIVRVVGVRIVMVIW